MFLRFHFGWLLAALCMGCTSHSVPTAYVFENISENVSENGCDFHLPHPPPEERKKMKIAVLPMVNATQEELPWDVAKEFHAYFHCFGPSSDDFSFISDREMEPFLAVDAPHLFDADHSFSHRAGEADFIVALELMEHDISVFAEEPLSAEFPAQEIRGVSVLNMKVKVRVLDVRDNHLRLIRQEIFNSDYRIPKGGSPVDYNRIRWNQKVFSASPWAAAHQRMISDLVARVEAILLSL